MFDKADGLFLTPEKVSDWILDLILLNLLTSYVLTCENLQAQIQKRSPKLFGDKGESAVPIGFSKNVTYWGIVGISNKTATFA